MKPLERQTLRRFFDHTHAHEDLTQMRKPLLISLTVTILLMALVSPPPLVITTGIFLLVTLVVHWLRWRVPVAASYVVGGLVLLGLKSALPGGTYSPEFIVSGFALLSLSQSLSLKKYWHGELFLLWLLSCSASISLIDDSATMSVWTSLLMFSTVGQMLRLHLKSLSLDTLLSSLRSAARTVLYTLPMLIVFVYVFQRSNQIHFHFSDNSVIGVSSNMEPGKVSRLTLRSGTAYRIETSRPLPPILDLYWRVGTLERSKGMKWSASADKVTGAGGKRRDVPVECRVDQKVYGQETDTRNSTVALDRPIEGSYQRGMPFQISSTICGRAGEGNTDAVSEIDTKVEGPVSDRVSRLALDIKSRFKEPADVAAAVLQHFKTGGYRYTLEPKKFSGGITLDDFLFGSKEGYCEHYAAATASLMRLAGVPARVVIGFQGGEYNDYGGFWSVAFQDAHAWTEYWDGRSWQRLDPTAAVAPQEMRFRSMARGWFGNLGRIPLVKAMWQLMDGLFFKVQKLFTGYDRILSLGDLTMDPVLALVSLILLLIIFQVKKYLQPLDAAVREQFAAFCEMFASKGIRRDRSEGYEHYRKRVMEFMTAKPKLEGRVPVVNDLFFAYGEFRYGAGEKTPAVMKMLLQQIKAARKQLRGKF